MSRYQPGDVVLVPIAIDARTGVKVRPAVVIRISGDHDLEICPVSSRSHSNTPSRPFSINDFEQGRLDLFCESYIMTSRVLTVQNADVIRKRGHLLPEYLRQIIDEIPAGRHRGR
jgi:hypothetical protein